MARLKQVCCLLALALLAPAAFAAAPVPAKPVAKITPIPPVGASPITPDCRYLFVVDMSSGMQRAADGLYRTTHRLVATGLGGRMQEGDVFTVWTYADTVLTREFPLNAWTPDLNIALANRTYEFLAQQKFRGKSNLRPVFAELGQALAISTNLTVVLVSDGTDVIVGTPFDRPINITYGKRASETRSAKMPFVTALVTERGEFTRWSVRAGLEDIGLPFPEKPVVPAPVIARAPIVVTPIPVVTNTPAPPPPPPRVVTAPKLVAPTNPPPVVVAAKPLEPVIPKPAPTPPVVLTPTPKPAPQKPPEPAPAVAVTKKPEPVPSPTTATKKADTNLPPPAPGPKQEAKPASPPPPKPVVAAPQPEVKQPAVAFVLQPIPPAIPPALRQPKSFIDASNALAKVELLRPPSGTSAPPAKPLEARVIEPKLAPPKTTNAAVAAAKPVPAIATNLPVAKPTTNATATTVPAKTIPIIIPPAKQPAAKPTGQKTSLTATNNPVRTNAPTQTATKPAKATNAAPATEVKAPGSQKPVKTGGQLAVASPRARNGGWVYLAAAVALLLAAGAIIARLLRPRPQPSAISQSLDESSR